MLFYSYRCPVSGEPMRRNLLQVLRKILAESDETIDLTYRISLVQINTDYEIPYLAGYSLDGHIIYIDKRLPRWFITKSGRKIDVYKYLIVHEVWEKYLEDTKNYKYPYAHEKATGKERQAVEKDKIEWDEYQGYMLKMVKKLEKFTGPLPVTLDTKPEKDTHDRYRYQKIQKIKEKELREGYQ